MNTFYDSSTKTWSGNEFKPISKKNESLATYIFEALSRNPDQIGQISDNSGVRFTNNQIRLNSIRLAMSLQREPFGVCKNDVLALVTRHHELVSAVQFAGLALAAPVCALELEPSVDEVIHLFGITRPKMVFCEKSTLQNVKDALVYHGLESTSRIVVIDHRVEGVDFVYDLIEAHDDEDLFQPTELEDNTKHPAILICTSGSTGPPKCVSIPHAMILEKIVAPSKQILTPNDLNVFFNFQTINGYMTLIVATIVGHGRIITTHSFDAQLLLSIVERYGVTFLTITHLHMSYMLQCPAIKTANLSSLKYVFCCGNPILNELQEKLEAYLPVRLMHSYGSTECFGAVSINWNKSGTDVTAGTLVPGFAVRVISEQNERCGPGVDGELYIRAPVSCLGYYNDAENTALAWDADGWYRSGDIGHFDENGFLYVIDRKTDMLHYNGQILSASALENTILGCPGVTQVCVVDISDTSSTNRLAAILVQSIDPTITANNIAEIVNGAFDGAVDFGERVYVVDKIPFMRIGKVNRDDVKRLALEYFDRND